VDNIDTNRVTTRVAEEADGWYLICGDERRGPFPARPISLGRYESTAVGGWGGESRPWHTTVTEIWSADEKSYCVLSLYSLTDGAERHSYSVILDQR